MAGQGYGRAGPDGGIKLGDPPRNGLAGPLLAPGSVIDQLARGDRTKRGGQFDRARLAGGRPPGGALRAGLEIALYIIIAQHLERLFAQPGAFARIALITAEILALGRCGSFGQRNRRALQPVGAERQPRIAGIAIDREQRIDDLQKLGQRAFVRQSGQSGQRHGRIIIGDNVFEQLAKVDRGIIGDDFE